MSFDEINPETAKPWTRAELFATLEHERAEATEVLKEVTYYDGPQADKSVIISWPEQAANLRARWAIHQDEFAIAIKDLKTLYKSVQVFIENQQEYWATNPLLKKQ